MWRGVQRIPGGKYPETPAQTHQTDTTRNRFSLLLVFIFIPKAVTERDVWQWDISWEQNVTFPYMQTSCNNLIRAISIHLILII